MKINAALHPHTQTPPPHTGIGREQVTQIGSREVGIRCTLHLDERQWLDLRLTRGKGYCAWVTGNRGYETRSFMNFQY